MGYYAGDTPKYSETWFFQMRTGCNGNEETLEFVRELEYWSDRLRTLSWYKFKYKKECKVMIAEREDWLNEKGVKPKILPPKAAIPPINYIGPFDTITEISKREQEAFGFTVGAIDEAKKLGIIPNEQ